MERFKESLSVIPSWIWLLLISAIAIVLLVAVLFLGAKLRPMRIVSKRISLALGEGRTTQALEDTILILSEDAQDGVREYLNGVCAERAFKEYARILAGAGMNLHWLFVAGLGVVGSLLTALASCGDFFLAFFTFAVTLVGACVIGTIGACFHYASAKAYFNLCDKLNVVFQTTGGATGTDCEQRSLASEPKNLAKMADEEMLDDDFVLKNEDEASDFVALAPEAEPITEQLPPEPLTKSPTMKLELAEGEHPSEAFEGELEPELAWALKSLEQVQEPNANASIEREMWQIIDEKLEAADRALEAQEKAYEGAEQRDCREGASQEELVEPAVSESMHAEQVIEPPTIPTTLVGEEAHELPTKSNEPASQSSPNLDDLSRRVDDFTKTDTEAHKILAADLRAERLLPHSKSDKIRLKEIIFKFLETK